MIKNTIKPIILPRWWQDLILALPRIICGLLLAIDFGASKFGMPWSPAEKNLGLFQVVFWFPEDVRDFGGLFALFPGFFAWMGAFSEAVGGLLLAIGFLTRINAFLILCTMLIAVFMQQWGKGTWNVLPALGFAWLAIHQMILGSGRFGLDYLISKKYGL